MTVDGPDMFNPWWEDSKDERTEFQKKMDKKRRVSHLEDRIKKSERELKRLK